MRRVSLALSVAFLALMPVSAQANDLTVRLMSSYTEATTFYDNFSNSPSLQLEGSVDLGSHAYVSAYVYSGFNKAFGDASSEYGVEAGWTTNVANGVDLTLALGRYANYEGRGFHNGDTYAKVSVDAGRVNVSASALTGVSSTGLINISYTLPVKGASVKVGVAYFTNTGNINPGVTASIALSKHCSLTGTFVIPKDGSSRKAVAAVGLGVTF